MASRYRNDENTIYIQYCRSCDTHSWCTHHDEAKYHETFLKFSEMMTHRMPEVEVIGNMVPPNLIPFKIAENKYIDATTNKYVVYPQIGSFEVTFRGKLIFSKKETHTWPNLPTIVSKVASIVNPEYQSPPKQEHQIEEDNQTSKVSNNNSFMDSEEDKKTKYKVQQKGFTLTDHFKMYRPKNTFQDKDWLTEKQESQASCRQISEMGRVHSRQKSEKKSDKSVQTKKSSDIVGQTKLKQMLKHKGMITKDQGKKEMIIRLDSIEEENIYEEAAAATQRTQDKNIKKNRMKQIDDQINALDDRFKNFENRVHDIQTRNKQFQIKPASSNAADDKSRFKQIIQNKREEMERNLSIKKSRDSEGKDAKEKALFADKTNKLEQYLNYSQQEKNDKLHRIYGEWKLIKQFSNKNKKLLKGKDKTGQEQIDDSESESTSKAYSHSQSPNSFANIITFKNKNQKILERKMKNMRNQKEHKYSSVERYHKVSSQIAKDIRNQTDQHFYNNRKFLRPKAEIQSEAQITTSQPISKLIKKSVNTLSMNALKSLTNNQSNLPKIDSQVNSVQNFSTSAKANINKISNRISNIQEKLKAHNINTFQPIEQTFHQSPYANRSRNISKKSQSRSGSEHNVSLKKLNRIYNNGNNERNNSNGNIASTIKKNYSHDKIKVSNFSEVARPQTKKINEKQSITEEREQEFKPHQSKRKEAKYIEANEDDPVVRDSPKKNSSKAKNSFNHINQNNRKVSQSKEAQIRQSKEQDARRAKQAENSKAKETDSKQIGKERKTQQASSQNQQSAQRKTVKEKKPQQLSNQHQLSDPKRAFRERKLQDHNQRQRNQVQNEQPKRYSQANQQEPNSHEHQYEFHPHQPRQAKPLERKFKDWRESSPTKNILKSKEIDRKVGKPGINEKIRQSDSKQTVIRNKKYKNNTIQQNQSIVSQNGQEIQNKPQVPVEQKKIRSGQIKRNRIKPKQSTHDDSAARQSHNSKERTQIKRGQIRNQKAGQLNSERTEGNEQAESSLNNESYRQVTNRFSSENQYQNSHNYENSSKITTVHNDQKLRKTLGYFKVNELCYRGVKTSQENRCGQKSNQVNQASFYQTCPNNAENLEIENSDEQQEESKHDEAEQEDQEIQRTQQQQCINHENQERNSEDQSSESQFVPQCKKQRCEKPQIQKEDPEQGWKGKSDEYENDDEMLSQQADVEQQHSQKQGRKNSLQRELERNDKVESEARNQEVEENYQIKSQKVVNEAQYSNEQVIRPQTTQEVHKNSSENIKSQEAKEQSPSQAKEQDVSEKVHSERQEKQTEYQNDFENQSQQQPQTQTVANPVEAVLTPIQAMQTPTQKEQTQLTQAQKMPIKKQSSKKPKVKKQAQKQIIDVELMTCKQYSEYLSYKISNELSKIDEKVPNLTQKVQNQENIGENRNAQICENNKMEQKIEQHPQAINFMTFESAQPAVEAHTQEMEDQQYDEEEDVVENEEQICETQPVSVQAKQTLQEPQKEHQSVKHSQNTVAQEIVENQEQKIKENKQQIVEQTKQGSTSIPQNEQKAIVSSPISNQVAISQHAPTQASNIEKSPQKISAIEPVASKSAAQVSSVPPQKIKKEQTQQNNVYCEPKSQKPRKFIEIGVQKQLTLEVSIQTDSLPHQNDIAITGRKSTPANTEEEGKKSTRSIQSKPRDNPFSEFQGTVRNNYLNQTKSSFRPQVRKEVIRAKITNQIFSDTRDQQMEKFSGVMSGRDESHIIKEEGAVTKMSAVYVQGLFMNERSLEVDLIKTKFTKVLKVLEILVERGEWILSRLFEDSKGLLQEKAFGVWLCLNFQWECFVVDDYIQVDESNQPLFTFHAGNQKWANVLEKAMARAMGGYEQLAKMQASQIFTMLTGCNSINVKVKEDPSKNGKLLNLINQCQRKNYIVHAEKSWQRIKDLERESIYYVLSVRRSNSDEQALLEVSQDGKESFWMRLSKFTQEFSKVEILQLRVNHNFNHIDIGISKENQLTVIELAFNQSGQGCVTLTYIDHVAPLTAYLYREEKSKVLKLVGQARQKQKSHLFFQCNFNEGRYYVFAQTKERPARLCYYGENTPSLKITEEIHNDGLKNQVAEYLPIRENKERPRREMEESWNDWRGKTPRLKDNFMESRLRENFVEYILGHNKRKETQF